MAITEGNFRLLQPADALAFTGERMTTAVEGQIESEHLHRYCLARDLCAGLDVLDVASGEGYGAAMLAGTARSVVGVELDAGAVAHASGAYALPNLRFEQGDAAAIPLPDGAVDIVVSFETIEHLDDPSAFLREVRRVLRPDGVLVVSTPDRLVYSAAGAGVNEFHRLEYTEGEFAAELGRHFAHVALFWQRPVLGSAVVPAGPCAPGSPAPGPATPAPARTYERRAPGIIEASGGLARAPYILAVAGNGTLPVVGPSHYLAQHGTQWVQETLARLGAAERTLTEQLHHVERVLEQRTEEVAARTRAAADAEGKFTHVKAVLDQERAALTRALDAARDEAREASQRGDGLAARLHGVDRALAERTEELEARTHAAEDADGQFKAVAAAFEQERATLAAQLDTQRHVTASLTATIETLRHDAEEAARREDGLARQLADAQAAVARLEDQVARGNAETSALAAQLDVQRHATASLTATLGTARQAANEAARREDGLARQLADAQAAVAQLGDDLRIWVDGAAQRDAEFAVTRGQLAAQERDAGAAQAQLTTLRGTVAALSRDLGAASAARDAGQAEAKAARHEALGAKAAAERTRTQLGRLEGEAVRKARLQMQESRLRRYRIGRALGLAPPSPSPTMAANARLVERFVDQFEPAPLMAPGPQGRTDRVLRFLLGAPDTLDDLPLFNAAAYAEMHPHVVAEGVNPLVHYVTAGQRQGLDLHPLIGTEWYRTRYPDCVALDMTPALHFANWGVRKGYDPHPLFDTRHYLSQYPDVAQTRINPLAHYLRFPGCNPHPLFDSAYYLDRNPDVAAGTMNPLVHYLLRGADEGRDPHPDFRSREYLGRHPDVARARINPLVHYVTHGGDAEGLRAASPRVHAVSAAPASVGPAAGAAGHPPRLLIVDATYPKPDRDAGSLNQVALIRIFQALGYEVHFAADLEFGVDTPYRDGLAALGVRCAVYPDYLSVEDFLEREGRGFSLFMLTRVHFGARHIDAARAASPGAKVIFNTVDLHYLREEREARLNDDPAALARAMETRATETALAANADATFVVSDREEELLRQDAPGARVVALPLFQGDTVARAGGFASRSGIGFIGGFKHAPNGDGVSYFLDEVWPLVRRALPGAEFFVIGADMPDSLLARNEPGVTVVGHVPDLAPWFARLRMTVAPLRYGAGAKGKVVGSLAHGVPCVASPIAAEGMGLVDGTDILVGATPDELAAGIVLLERDEARWTALSDAGMAVIRKRFSLDHGTALLRGVLASIGAPVPR